GWGSGSERPEPGRSTVTRRTPAATVAGRSGQNSREPGEGPTSSTRVPSGSPQRAYPSVRPSASTKDWSTAGTLLGIGLSGRLIVSPSSWVLANGVAYSVAMAASTLILVARLAGQAPRRRRRRPGRPG